MYEQRFDGGVPWKRGSELGPEGRSPAIRRLLGNAMGLARLLGREQLQAALVDCFQGATATAGDTGQGILRY